MGDWDVGAFDNDTAKEWLIELMSGESTSAILRAIVNVAKLPATDYLQAPECEIAVAAAELVVAARGNPPVNCLQTPPIGLPIANSWQAKRL